MQAFKLAVVKSYLKDKNLEVDLLSVIDTISKLHL